MNIKVERAKAAMDNDPNHDEEAYIRVEDALTAVDSAVQLQLKSLEGKPMLFIKQHFIILESGGHKLPMMHLIVITRVYCKEVVTTHIQGWASALRPLKRLEDTSFSIDSPCYADTNAMRMSPQSPEYKMFVDSWLASVFPNNFWKMLKEISAGEDKRQALIELCQTFLAMIEGVDFEDVLDDDKVLKGGEMPFGSCCGT